MDQGATVPLSVLVDRMAGPDGARDRDFVRALSQWLHDEAAHLKLQLVEALRLDDVVLTFQMRERVKLVITGYPPDGLPGAVTVHVDERDFPFVLVAISDAPAPRPYEICTLDYSLAGREVEILAGPHAGARGVVVVAATVGETQENRIRLDGAGVVVTLRGDDLRLLP